MFWIVLGAFLETQPPPGPLSGFLVPRALGRLFPMTAPEGSDPERQTHSSMAVSPWCAWATAVRDRAGRGLGQQRGAQARVTW